MRLPFLVLAAASHAAPLAPAYPCYAHNTCDACAAVVCGSWTPPSTVKELRWLILVLPKEQVGCCVDTSELTDLSSLGYSIIHSKQPDGLNDYDNTHSFIPDRLVGTIPLDAFGTNDPICWDTAKVTTFENMVNGATKFNGALVGWDTSKVTSMKWTFYRAEAFNHPLAWDTSKVTNFYLTFFAANNFNAQLDWDTSKVTSFHGFNKCGKLPCGCTQSNPTC